MLREDNSQIFSQMFIQISLSQFFRILSCEITVFGPASLNSFAKLDYEKTMRSTYLHKNNMEECNHLTSEHESRNISHPLFSTQSPKAPAFSVLLLASSLRQRLSSYL